mgnify:CR=1 FL=1
MGFAMNDRTTTPHVVILGAGFGGLACARALRRAPVSITIIDRTNHHVFQPLLYQVATAGLSPGEIATPIRHIFARHRSVEVILGEALAIDAEARTVRLADRAVPFDYLVLATGARTSYFGHDDWEPFAPGLKTIADALEIRHRFLLAFEHAELESNPDDQRARLTFVVIGGGPTGVELAGTMAELSRKAFVRDFRRIDTATARIILVEAGPRLLPSFSEHLSARARTDLERLGVQVWLGTRVTAIDATGISIGDDRIATQNVFWAAGVEGTPIAATLPIATRRDGRIDVGPDLSVPGRPRIFVVGDLARVVDARTGREVPGVAPAAMQMGAFVGRLIGAEARGAPTPPARPEFRYADKGTLATIGRATAVAQLPRISLTGLPAWLFWLGLHIFFLIGFRSRVLVLIQWAWSYLTYERGARLITDATPARPSAHDPARK